MNEYENILKIKGNSSFILQSKDCNLSDAKDVTIIQKAPNFGMEGAKQIKNGDK